MERSTMVMSQGSRIEACTVGGSGGGVLVDAAQLRLIGGSSIRRCSAFDGGAVALISSSILLNESSVSGCSASASGGAFWLKGSRITLLDVLVSVCPSSCLGCPAILKPTLVNASGCYMRRWSVRALARELRVYNSGSTTQSSLPQM